MLDIHAVFVDTSRARSRFSVYTLISLHQVPLQDNGHWFLCQIETLYMVIVT